jgi:hypothetical protein
MLGVFFYVITFYLTHNIIVYIYLYNSLDLETDIVNNEDCITQINVFDMAFEVDTDPNLEIYSDKMVNIDDSLAVIEGTTC